MRVGMGIALLAGIVLLSIVPVSEGATIIVDDDDTTHQWSNYTTIQDAQDNANNRDIIRVYNGTYYETIDVNVSISIVGNSSEECRVEANGTGNIIEVASTDWVTVSGLWLNNSGPSALGLYFSSSSNCTAVNVTVTNCPIGIRGRGSDILFEYCNSSGSTFAFDLFLADNSTARYCDMSGGGTGIRLWRSPYNMIYGNRIFDVTNGIHLDEVVTAQCRVHDNEIWGSSEYGIVLDDMANWNKIYNNTIHNGTAGIAIQPDTPPHNNTIYWNLIENNSWAGIFIRGVNNTAHNNTVKKNQYGFYLLGGETSVIVYNEIFGNSDYAFLVNGAHYCVFHHNNVFNNGGTTSQASDSYILNDWDDGAEGNWWSDWNGTGTYSIDGTGNAEDRYPLNATATTSAPEKVPEFGFLLAVTVVLIAAVVIRRRH